MDIIALGTQVLTPEEEIVSNEQIEELLSHLKPKQAELVTMWAINRMTFNQISLETGINQKTVEKSVRTSLKKLRQKVGNMAF